ncbi:hypothetical protein [Nonomuraea dietziae]|uniref:hypothetical protein n=1 Tax=Nonomuraea dietziae TaxID=65515 RepID=UPI0034444034
MVSPAGELLPVRGVSAEWPRGRHSSTPTPAPGDATTSTWVYIQSALQDGNGDACVLNVQGGSTTPGANVIVWPRGGTVGHNELWQILPDGRVLSAQGDNLVLTLGTSADGGGNYVTVDTQRSPLPLTQVWDFSTPKQIRNAFAGEFLVPSGATDGPITLSDGDAVLVAPGSPSASYTWYTAPSASLQEIMAQQQTPFQGFTGGQADAYDALLAKLQITSLRAEYYNLDTTLSDYGSQIALWAQAPDGVEQTDWGTVRDQLLLEIRYANTTRNLFANYRAFHLALFVDNGALLNEAIADAGLTQGDNAQSGAGTILAILEGLAYAVLEATPGAGPVLGNLMAAGVNIALAAGSDDPGSISPDPFQVAVSELWGKLSADFDALLISMGNMEITILQDWGKLQSVYQLTRPQQNGCDSLSWDPNTTAQLVNAARAGYMISVMQMLLPLKYQIYSTVMDYFPEDCPDSAKWQSNGTNYWIASNTDAEVFPADWTMQKDIWGNGVLPQDFFLSCSRWGFPTADGAPIDAWWGRLTFTNLTPNLLALAGSEAEINVQVPPYQSTWVDLNAPVNSGTNTYTFQVADLNNPKGVIPAFTVKVPWRGPTISITTPSDVSGYQFTPTICNAGDDGPGGDAPSKYSATVQVGLIQT